MAVASLVLGIIALVFSFTGGLAWIAWILGVVGIILGVLGKKKDPSKKGMATAGMVLSIIAVALGIIMYIACVACINAAADALTEAGYALQ